MPLLDAVEGLAAKAESVYATDPTIAEADDSIETRNLNVAPMDGDFINRNLDGGGLGAQGDIAVAKRCLITTEVEIAGAGGAGDVPGWGRMLEGCGFAETIDAGVDVEYDPVGSAFTSMWLEANKDGNQHIAKGGRGNMTMSLSSRAIPFFTFAYTGLYQVPTAVPIPTYDFSDFQTPEAVNNENTVTATLHGVTMAMESFTLNMQNQVEHRDIVGNEEILITDRNVRGTIVLEAPLVSTKNWFNAAALREVGTLQIVHGDTAGNIFQVDAPVVEVSNPQYGASQGVLTLSLDIICKPNTQNDEIKITAK